MFCIIKKVYTKIYFSHWKSKIRYSLHIYLYSQKYLRFHTRKKSMQLKNIFLHKEFYERSFLKNKNNLERKNLDAVAISGKAKLEIS